MHRLTDYVLAIRPPAGPPPPAGIKTVELVPGEGDAVASTIAALVGSGLTPADMRSRAIFMAPPDGGLVTYAALCGFAGRRVDAYADGAVLEFSRLDPEGAAFPDAGRPPGHLMWGQVGGPDTEGMPTVHIDTRAPHLVSPQAVTVIRYAARLRMVPPASARDALAIFLLVAALRRRADDRFPYLSTGTEPVPATKDDPDQGIDLEKVRREASAHRRRLQATRQRAEMVPPEPVSSHDLRIAKANATDIQVLLQRLGSAPQEGTLWHCPRPGRHGNGDENPSLRVYGADRVKCHRCDAEKIGPVRLAVEVLGVTPDEAAGFILEAERTVDVHAL